MLATSESAICRSCGRRSTSESRKPKRGLAHLVRPDHRLHDDDAVAHPQRGQLLAVADRDLDQADLPARVERVAQQHVRLDRVLLRLEVVALGEVDRVDLLDRHELQHVDDARGRQRQVGEVLVGQDDRLAARAAGSPWRCRRRRPPRRRPRRPACSGSASRRVRRTWWKLTSRSSVAVYSFTPMLTSPKEMLPFQIERIGLVRSTMNSRVPTRMDGCSPCSLLPRTCCPAAPAGRTSSSGTACGRCWTSPTRGVRLYSRRRQRDHRRPIRSWSRWPPAPSDALLDGEIVAFVDGRPSFEALQARMHVRAQGRGAPAGRRSCPVTFVAFDLLRRYGVDLTARPYASGAPRWSAGRPTSRGWTLSPSFDDGPAHRGRPRGSTASRASSPSGSTSRVPPGRAHARLASSCASSAPATSRSSAGRRRREPPGHAQFARPRAVDDGGLRVRRQGGQRADRARRRPRCRSG